MGRRKNTIKLYLGKLANYEFRKKENNSMIIKYKKTDNVLKDVCAIIDSAKNYAYQSVNIDF